MLWLRRSGNLGRCHSNVLRNISYNDNWAEDDEQLDAETFMQRIALEAMTLSTDGSAQLFYHDGDLFAGHIILVSLNDQLNFQSADIAG